jgi:hypothetical protein
MITDPSSDEVEMAGVAEAVLAITRGGERYDLSLVPNGVCVTGESVADDIIGDGCYFTILDTPFAAGDSIRLEGTAPGYAPIGGSVVVPSGPAILAPSDGDTVSTTLANNRASGEMIIRSAASNSLIEAGVTTTVARCAVTLRSADVRSRGTGHGTLRFGDAVADSVRGRIGIACVTTGGGPQTPPNELSATITLLAYDSLYSQYLELTANGGSLPLDEASIGLSGGVIGYLAAAGRSSVTFTLTTEASTAVFSRERIPTLSAFDPSRPWTACSH